MAETLDSPLPDRLQDKAEKVLETAHERDRSVVTAESCTGGLLAALLTDIPGKSHMFERGFVVYSEESKCELLGLERELVSDCGAVSKAVAVAMAKGALAHSDGALAISITGFAGPPAKDEDGEEGLVHFACAGKDGHMDHHEHHFGPIGRQGVRIEALDVALDMLLDGLRA